jgi:hypothetical protein
MFIDKGISKEIVNKPERMKLIFLYDRHMTSKTFTKQNPALLCNHDALHKNVQVFFEYIPPTKELLVKLLLPICLSFYSMFCIIWVNVIPASRESFFSGRFNEKRFK